MGEVEGGVLAASVAAVSVGAGGSVEAAVLAGAGGLEVVVTAAVVEFVLVLEIAAADASVGLGRSALHLDWRRAKGRLEQSESKDSRLGGSMW